MSGAHHHNTMKVDEALLILIILVMLQIGASGIGAAAQTSPSSPLVPDANSHKGYSAEIAPNSFSPSMAIVIVVVLCTFFFLGFFSIFIRRCSGSGLFAQAGAGAGTAEIAAGAAPSRGLDPKLLETFPTVVYSEVKDLKIGSATALECAVCLNEFDDDEPLRILPKCSHVFHPDCIGAWLASHVTCPLCRANLSDLAAGVDDDDDDLPSAAAGISNSAPDLADQVAVEVEDDDRKADLADLARIASERRRRSKRFQFPRSHTTGHSLSVVDMERYTLRLPEHAREQIMAAAGRIQRISSWAASPAGGGGGDGGSRRGSRSSRGTRSGRSDRWPSFIARTISTRLPAWATGRWPEGEGSTTRKGRGGGGGGEGSFKRMVHHAGNWEWLGGGGGAAVKPAVAGEDEASTSAAASARV